MKFTVVFMMPKTVRADGIGDVTDVDRVQVLVIGSSFYKKSERNSAYNWPK